MYDAQRYGPTTTSGSGSQAYPESTGKGISGSTSTNDHPGRDAALAGGAGAGLGGAVYEAERHHQAQNPTAPTQPTQSVAPIQPTQPVAPKSTKEPQTYYGAATTTRDPSQVQAYEDPKKEHHLGRDAAAGTAIAGAGAAGYEDHRKHEEKELAKEKKAHDKAIAKEQRHEEKEIAKEQKAHEKAISKEQKSHEKAIAKEQKREEKELAKGHQRDEKAVVAEEGYHDGNEEKDKKPSLVDRLLHRNKDDDQPGKENAGGLTAAEGAGAAGVAGTGAYEYEKHQGSSTNTTGTQDRNRLHKDPPADYYQGVEYAEKPTSGYASQVTGGTGTTALAKGDDLPSGSHWTSAGNALDPKYVE